jgi:long-chain acyl-CoA synthetase
VTAPAPHELDDAPGDAVVVEEWLGAPALSYARRPATVVDALDRAVRLFGDRPGWRDGSSWLTWAQFAGRVEQAADALRGRGLQPGDAVAVASGNTLDLAVLLLACARAGLVMVGLNTRLAPPQWAYMVEHMQVRLRLASPPFLSGLDGALPLAEVLRAAPERAWEPGPSGLAPAAPYAVVFTSGTTGRPKASLVVHRASVHSGMSYQRVLQLGPDDVTAVLFPMYYISAMHAHVLPAMLAGARIVLVDKQSPREYVDLLREEGVTWAYAVPSWWRLALRAGLADLPRLTRLAAGGAPFPRDLQASLREALPGVRLHDVYGLSETHSPGCILQDHEFAEHGSTVGRPLDCLEAQVRDEFGIALPAGSPGELWLRGSLVTTGYSGDPDATAQAIVEGWFDTGDIARICVHGFVTVLDRSKDMINRGGTKVFSAELEGLLRTHPAVEDAAVIGIPDALGGEAIAAYLVTSGPVEASEVRAWVREGMADYAVPKRIEVVDALPRNAVGKTDKQALRARHT